MKVAIYARVSTDDKDQDPERQIMKCEQYCELHNHTICYRGSDSITGDSNPLERQLFKDILELQPDAIVVYSIDRLTRQHPVKVFQLLTNLKNQGIKIISITEPAFNMEGEMSDLIQYLLTWFNNYFLTSLKRNVKSGIERARAKGKQIGRAKAEFNKYRAYHLLFNEKRSQRFVSKELGVSLATINRFKKVAEKEPSLFINKDDCSQTVGFETR